MNSAAPLIYECSTPLCTVEDLVENSGICLLVGTQQVALFYLPNHEPQLFAVSNWDPIGKASVISRGMIGSLGDRVVVASPLYKQHFDLVTGACIEDDQYSLVAYPIELVDGKVYLKPE